MAGIPVADAGVSVIEALRRREVGGEQRGVWQAGQTLRSLKFQELVGHRGCVNRLAWDLDEGTVLASVSDDLKILLWPLDTTSLSDLSPPGLSPPGLSPSGLSPSGLSPSGLSPSGPSFTSMFGPPCVVPTLHTQNIFGVGFLPRSHGELLVTGSMDGTVQLHRLERGGVQCGFGGERGRSSPVSPREVGTHTQTFACHMDRVKDIEVSRHEPSLFWSCSEDGTVRQYDVRMRNAEQNAPDSPNVLLHSPNLVSSGLASSVRAQLASYFVRYAKYQGVNSIRVNPIRPELIAVASQSPHVHVFDRRMCGLGRLDTEVDVCLRTGFANSGSNSSSRGLVRQFVYPMREAMRDRPSPVPQDVEIDIRPSYVSWGERGDLLVANYSSGPAVTWSYAGRGADDNDDDDVVVRATRRSEQSQQWEVREPNVVESYWEKYKRTRPFDVERSMSDLSRVRMSTGGTTTGRGPAVSPPPGHLGTLRAMKKFVSRLSWEQLEDMDLNDHVRDISQEYAMWTKQDPGRPDLDKEFLELLWGEYTLRVRGTRMCDLLYLVACPMTSVGFEVAGVFIATMAAAQRWPLKTVDDRDAPEGEWMAAVEVQDYVASLHRIGETSWIQRHFDSRRKERTIGARYETSFQDILKKLVGEQHSRPGTFNRAYWTGDGCKKDFGATLSLMEAGIIEAWITYFEKASKCEDVAEALLGNSINTPITLLGAPGSESFQQVYCYHSNENTDIKEAVFFGGDAFVLAASDSGAVVAYDESGEAVCVLESDSAIANCVRPHPRLPIIVTSGIDDTIKVWSPFAGTNERVVTDEAALDEFWKNDLEQQRIHDFGGVSFSFGGDEGMSFAQLLGMLMRSQEDYDD